MTSRWPPKAWLEHRLSHDRHHANVNAVFAALFVVSALAGAPWFLWLPCVAVFTGAAIDHAIDYRRARRELDTRAAEPSLTLTIRADSGKAHRQLREARRRIDELARKDRDDEN